MVRNPTYSPNARKQPDPIRIAAISASIAANIALFMFLMQPMNIAPKIETADVPFVRPPDWYKKPKVVPVTPQPPQTNKDPAHPQPRPRPVPTPDPRPPVIKLTAGPLDPPVPPALPFVPKGDPVNTVIGPVRTIQSASLTPIVSPAPEYPIDAVRDSITGKVLLELLVGVDGHVIEVHVIRSSGNRELDNAARDQVLRNWRFEPAVEDGVPVQALGRVPIVFTLNGQ